MIERLLPDGVFCDAVRADEPDARLFPEEEAQFGRAVASRLAEIKTARSCARRALGRLGLPALPILRGPQREPLWPAGVVGSITHCTGYRAAAVAREADFLTIGIDAEPHLPLPTGVGKRVLDTAEQAWLAQAPAGIHWDRLLFSAKESVYKAWFPLTQRWLGFENATLEVDAPAGVFRARLLVPAPPLAEFSGRFLIDDGLLLTVIAVRR